MVMVDYEIARITEQSQRVHDIHSKYMIFKSFLNNNFAYLADIIDMFMHTYSFHHILTFIEKFDPWSQGEFFPTHLK